MYWQLKPVPAPEDAPATPPSDARRFVLHRHRDPQGPHLDLRLEQEGYLVGWRISSTHLADTAAAAEKAPHPLHWLEQDRDSTCEDQGMHAWHTHDAHGGTLLLWGRNGLRAVEARRVETLDAHVLLSLSSQLREQGLAPEDLPALIDDGATARKRAIQRFCGLGRELDGTAFDEEVWRKTLQPLKLSEIHQHLRAYELRFDQKYPPQPVSRPEPLPDEQHREDLARAILTT